MFLHHSQLVKNISIFFKIFSLKTIQEAAASLINIIEMNTDLSLLFLSIYHLRDKNLEPSLKLYHMISTMKFLLWRNIELTFFTYLK